MNATHIPRPALVALLVLFVSPLALAQGVGGIGGIVQDASGAVIPGVTLTLSNPGTIGANQSAVSDQRGAYQFSRLVPSRTYSVRAELDGFRSAMRSGVVVTADSVARVDLTLELGDLSETLTVTGQSALVDTTSTYRQTVLTRDTLEVLPTGKDIWSIGRLVPALIVGKYDVGGSESMYASDVTLHGSLKAEGNFLVDGVDVSNTATPGQSGLYPDTGMFQEVNYQAGNAPAESDRGGVTINMVSRTGTNRLAGRVVFTGTNNSLGWENLTPAQRADLRAAVPPRVIQINPNLESTTKLQSQFNSSVDVSGPIIRDHLWFSASGQVGELNRYWLGSYTTDGNQILDDSWMRGWSSKVSWQAGPNTQLHYLHTYTKRANLHRTATALTTANDFYERRAMTTQFLPVYFDSLRLTRAFSSRLILEAMVARFRIGVASPPADASVGPGDIPRFDSVTRTYMQAYTNGSDSTHYGDPVHASLNYVAGDHDVKFGYQAKIIRNTSYIYTFSHFPAGLRAVYRNGVPDSVNTYNAPVSQDQRQLDQALYVQDRWRASRKLTLNVGLRLQRSNGWIPPGCQRQTIFVDERCFEEISDVPDWLDLAPRFGAVYDILGSGKTVLKVAANRYSIPFGTGFSSNVNPLRLESDTRSWVDRNGDGDPQLDELGPSTGFNFGTTNRYEPNVERPYSNELSVEVEQQLFGDVVVSAGYYYRGLRRQIGSRNLAVPRESYTPIEVTERTSGQQVTVYNQDPSLRGRFDVLFDNYSELDGQFNGFDVTFNKRMSNGWMVFGGLSFGENVGDVYGTADLNNPNNTYRRGVVGTDVPVSFKVSGAYELPYKITLSGSFQHYTGFPELDQVIVGSNTIALTQVSQTITIAPRGANRLDDVNALDFSARRSFRIGQQLIAEPVIEMFNVMNVSPVQGRTTVLGPAYHRAASIMRGRMLKFGFTVKY